MEIKAVISTFPYVEASCGAFFGVITALNQPMIGPGAFAALQITEDDLKISKITAKAYLIGLLATAVIKYANQIF